MKKNAKTKAKSKSPKISLTLMILLTISITEGMMIFIIYSILSQAVVFQAVKTECLPANQNGTYTCGYELPKGCIDGYYLQPFKNEGFEYTFECTFTR